ncbi:MAG: glycosyltransferase, partial [Candidatus Hodarchaeota archaeon]
YELLKDQIKIFRLVSKRTGIIINSPMIWYTPILPLIALKSFHFSYYVANDHVTLAHFLSHQRGVINHVKAILTKCFGIIGLRMCDSILVRGDASRYSQFKKKVYTSFPIISLSSNHSFRQDTCQNATITLLYVGGLYKRKRLMSLLQTFKLLIKEERSFKKKFSLRIVGYGQEYHKLKRAVTELGISDKVFFIGWIDDPVQLAKEYLNADIFILPSVLTEGFPRVIQEAMYYGLPVITFNQNYPKFLKHKENIIFINPEKDNEFKIAILELITNRKLRKRIINNSQIIMKKIVKSPAIQHTKIIKAGLRKNKLHEV